MPTGTGKTETMLCALVANGCKKLLVTVPSDSFRSQLGGTFLTLGLLKEFGIVGDDYLNPIVGIIEFRFGQVADLEEFISGVNVVVTTMSIVARSSVEAQNLMTDQFSHLFVDEAHHAEATTWQNFIGKFKKDKVFLFTATPYRNEGKKPSGKFIFNFSLKKVQEQKYYKKINFDCYIAARICLIMELIKVIVLTCGCYLRKKINYQLELSEKPAGKDAYVIQVSCPFTDEAPCKKDLTVELPLGLRPKESKILRE